MAAAPPRLTTATRPVLNYDSITDKLHELVRSSQRRVLVVIAVEDTWPRLLIAYRRHLAGAGIPVVPAGQPPMPGVGITGAWTTVTTPAAALRADVEHHRHHREGLIHMAPITHTPMMATRLHLNLGQSIIWPHRPEAQGGHS